MVGQRVVEAWWRCEAGVWSRRDDTSLGEMAGGDHWQPFWLGLYQADLCTWSHVSECTSDFEAWAIGEPDNFLGDQNCVISTDGGWRDTRCSDSEFWGEHIHCICEQGRNTSLAYLQWDGPTLQFGIKGRRSSRDDTAHALAIAAGFVASFAFFPSLIAGDMFSNPGSCTLVKSPRVVMLSMCLGFVPGLFLLMAAFLGSGAANCRDDPISPMLVGFVQVALGVALMIFGRMLACWTRMRTSRRQVEAETAVRSYGMQNELPRREDPFFARIKKIT